MLESAYLIFGRFRWFLAEFGMGSGKIRDEFGTGFKTSTKCSKRFKSLAFQSLILERFELLNVEKLRTF